ncbi:Transcription factor like [Quillaja saponaria]|uniref:Transcription factor like n=1 Tax=Quillaja saponaria TaxID=32244 RepID=A0AAD7PL36_QUISA|nr:Transcription factor like [Quillaja saponaria]
MYMSSPSTQFPTSRRMGIYEPFQQVSMWGDTFKSDGSPNRDASSILLVNGGMENRSDQLIPQESTEPSVNDQEANRNVDKVQRRLAQNREAARKSRIRKKAYVKQLESSRLKLMQLELEIEKARKQSVYIGGALDTTHMGFSGTVNSGIAVFEMEYGHWIEEQHRQNSELRIALQAHVSDLQLHMLVESGLNHYYNLFKMKADAAKADVFYLLSGVWRTSVERFFHWIGGFRPSELLNVLLPQLESLNDQQRLSIKNLCHSSQQAEDALSQGLDKLQQTLAQSIAADVMGLGTYGCQMAAAMEKMEAVESFMSQADHLRRQTLQQMSRILTTHQAARGLLTLGEYFHHLRALSSLWTARPIQSS